MCTTRCGEMLQRDKDFVLACVEQNGSNLIYVRYFELDEEIALAAVRQDGLMFYHVAGPLKQDKKFLNKVLQHDNALFGVVDYKFKCDEKQLILSVFKRS